MADINAFLPAGPEVALGAWMAERGIEGGFDLQRRAEEVPVADYIALAAALSPRR